ncbi:MAG: ABC transporter ATP-binding protein [Tumebacillaceae bacterium]
MSNAVVTFEHVVKKFPGRTALADVSLALPQGNVIGVVGPNGSGKSTMLKLMAGLLRPNTGSVLVNGQAVGRRSAATIAYLSDENGCYPFYTVAETLQYYATLFADFDLRKARDMLEFMKLDPQQRVGSLSKGNLARLKMVLTLSRNAPLVLLDEPLSGLDPLIRDSIIKGLIAFINVPEQTVIMTTHEVAEVEPLLDMVVGLQDGRIVCIDEVENIRSTYGYGLVAWMKEAFRS